MSIFGEEIFIFMFSEPVDNDILSFKTFSKDD